MVHLWSLLSESIHEGTMLHTPTRHDEPFSGPALTARAERTAGGLLTERGGRPPARAGLLMANGEPWVRGLLALLRLDAAAVPLALPVAFGGADAYTAHIRRIAESAELDMILVDTSIGRRITARVEAAVPGVRVVDISEPPQTRRRCPRSASAATPPPSSSTPPAAPPRPRASSSPTTTSRLASTSSRRAPAGPRTTSSAMWLRSSTTWACSASSTRCAGARPCTCGSPATSSAAR